MKEQRFSVEVHQLSAALFMWGTISLFACENLAYFCLEIFLILYDTQRDSIWFLLLWFLFDLFFKFLWQRTDVAHLQGSLSYIREQNVSLNQTFPRHKEDKALLCKKQKKGLKVLKLLTGKVGGDGMSRGDRELIIRSKGIE